LISRLTVGWALLALATFASASAEGLDASRLGVLYNRDDPSSRQVALYYVARRSIPPENVLGVSLPPVRVLAPEGFATLRQGAIDRMPAAVQSLLLVWSQPYAVGCMSITSGFAGGYNPATCRPGCARTQRNPLFDSEGWLPADTIGWWPAMLMPSDDVVRARALIDRGIAADFSAPGGTVYLVRTDDAARNVRARSYEGAMRQIARRVRTVQLSAPVTREISDAIGYFTGAARVAELPLIHFRPGALADHLTSTGGVLAGGHQMSAEKWLSQGATASYGTVSEPCNFTQKFPDVAVLFDHYLHGETALEAYWKSVAWVGQGLFIGEPLSRPYAERIP
jgi:uncharacterized protein (TIGR03790 family)